MPGLRLRGPGAAAASAAASAAAGADDDEQPAAVPAHLAAAGPRGAPRPRRHCTPLDSDWNGPDCATRTEKGTR